MTEWLLVLIIYSGYGIAITTVKVPDNQSCIRAGKFHKLKNKDYEYECIEITKEKKDK